MRKLHVGLLACVLLGGGLAATALAQADAPPRVRKAMQELWRRGHCLLSSVYKPAGREAVLPRDLASTSVLVPRVFSRAGPLLCYAADGRTLWAADDQCLYRADGAAGKLTGRFDLRSGLPAEPIQSIAAAGGTVWLAARGRLAGLDAKTGKVAVIDEVRFDLGRLAAGAGGAWLVSDAGAWRLAAGEKTWRRLPDFPAQEQLARAARRGFWHALWRKKLAALVPSMLPGEAGLTVVCQNQLLHYSLRDGKWHQVSSQAWYAVRQGPNVWALTTSGVVRFDPASGRTQQFASGQGPARGRPVALAATPEAIFLLSRPDYDGRAERFVGGGISRLDLASGQWTITEEVNGTDVRFVTAAVADGQAVWAACTLYDRAIQLGAHPGMAHVKRWRPHAGGIGLLHYADGKWTLLKREGLKTERRWVMGQKGTVASDLVGPDSVDRLCCCGGRVWGVYRIVPDRYYAGYFISAGCLAERSGGRWQGRFDARTDELDMGGEQPELMLISHSHGERIVLAEGHPIVLGIENVGGRAWVISESGLFAYDAGSGKFAAAVRQPMRLYWRATAAAAGEKYVWFGGDGGSISRLDRDTGRLELVGIAPGRKITRMAVEGDRLVVGTAAAPDVVLPVCLASAPRLPTAEVLSFDGESWTAGPGRVARRSVPYTFRRRSNYLYRDGRRAAFLKGVFRPEALCEDPVGEKLWLSVYTGVASIPLPEAQAK